MKPLLEATKDRVIKVQAAAKDALLRWKRAMERFEQLENAKTSQVYRQISPDDLINIRASDEFPPFHEEKKVPNLLKNESVAKAIGNKSDFGEVFQRNAGWIAETKGRNFIKKKSGTGKFNISDCLGQGFEKVGGS